MSDAAYNNIHQWTAETTADSREQWARAAEKLAALNPAHVIAGHKDPDRNGSPDILAETAQYLREFNCFAPLRDAGRGAGSALLLSWNEVNLALPARLLCLSNGVMDFFERVLTPGRGLKDSLAHELNDVLTQLPSL